ncbi:MAG: QueT transporter family protein [Clostridia bacterium]|nr:QueT transporter family protein [Clostridia bacterium]
MGKLRKDYMKFSAKFIVQASLIAAVYAILTTFLQSFGFGPIQFRLAEAMTVLPAILPASIPGLFVGCILANILGGFGIIDIVFGSLATLLAAVCTYLLRKNKFLFPFPPVFFNALIVGAYVYILYDKTYPMPLTMLFIGISEFILAYGLGLTLVSFIKSNKGLRKSLEISE